MENKDIIVGGGYAQAVEEETFVPNNPLRRPKMHYKKPIIALAVYLVQLLLLIPIPYGAWWIRTLVLIGYSAVYLLFIAKRAIIWTVHLYQNRAKDETRLRCVMEPSCSEYMILAVEKYGAIRGVIKGIGRLHRCGIENGIDYP